MSERKEPADGLEVPPGSPFYRSGERAESSEQPGDSEGDRESNAPRTIDLEQVANPLH